MHIIKSPAKFFPEAEEPARYYVTDDNGAKCYPALGYETLAACLAFVNLETLAQHTREDKPRHDESTRHGQERADTAFEAGWLRFNIMRDFTRLRELRPDDELVVALAAVLDSGPSVDPKQGRLF